MRTQFTFILLALTLMFGCKSKSVLTQKQSEATENNAAVSASMVYLKILIRDPYCKGMAPMPDEEVNGFTPLLLKDFVLFHNDTFMFEFRTSDQGVSELFLPPGSYGVRHSFKNVDFETFYKTIDKRSSEMVEVGDKECYQKWWEAYEGSFEVGPLSEHAEIKIESWCFTGEDPCRSYVGPMPP